MSPHVERSVRIREARERVVNRTPEQAHLDSFKLGTAWVAPGQGSTWRDLLRTFGQGYIADARAFGYDLRGVSLDTRTNLLLTSALLTAEDRRRWESGSVA